MKLFKKEHETIIKVLLFGIPLLLLALGASSSYYTVDSNEEAVVIRWGKFYETHHSGLHFKLPFGIDQKWIVKTALIHVEEFGFRSKKNGAESFISKEDLEKESAMLTGDLNVAEVKWVVLYRISDSFKFLFAASDPVRNIRDVAESIMRRVVGDRLVSDVLTTGRVEIAADAKKLMQEVLDRYDLGITILGVKLQDVNPPDVVRPSFNEVNAAKQEQEKVINMAEKIYNQEIPKARGQAEETIAKAEGNSTSILNHARGDAEKFGLMLKSYKAAPQLTRKRLYLETMQELLQRFNNVRIIDPNIKALLPLTAPAPTTSSPAVPPATQQAAAATTLNENK